MDRNYIVELVKDNRLQEALKAIEKASKGSHLHNQIIILSSSYAEYAQMNRSATQDAQSLEIKRAKITNSLLSFLDELSPEELEQVEMPKRSVQQTVATHPSVEPTSGVNKKMYLYAAGACVVLALAYLGFSNGEADVGAQIVTPDAMPTSTSTVPAVAPQTVSVQPAKPATVSPTSTPTVTNTPVSNNKPTVSQPTHAAVNGHNVGIVEFNTGQDKVGTFEYNGSIWIEESGATHKFREVSRDDWSVYLHDDGRNVNIQLDLYTKEIKYSVGKGAVSVLYKITHFDE